MNLYFLVEGEKAEKQLYTSWITFAFPQLREVDRPEDVAENTYRLVAGYGYPNILKRVDEVLQEIDEVILNRIDRLFVCVDAEEESFDDRLKEVESRIEMGSPTVKSTVLVQDCCIETWLLGNRRFIKPDPAIGSALRPFLDHYNVRERDPEAMPSPPPKLSTRAQYQEAYLKAACRERHSSYSKSRVGPTATRQYFDRLVERYEDADRPGHLSSFGRLVESWRSLEAEI